MKIIVAVYAIGVFCQEEFDSVLPTNARADFFLEWEMDVVGGNRVIEHAQAIALPRLKEPLKPTSAVSRKLQEEFLFMTAMSDVPGIARHVMPACPRHEKPS